MEFLPPKLLLLYEILKMYIINVLLLMRFHIHFNVVPFSFVYVSKQDILLISAYVCDFITNTKEK